MIFRKKYILAGCLGLISLLFGQNKIYGQDAKEIFSSVENQKWMPRQAILSIYQDHIGFLWIGTRAGLFKYDLYQLRNFNLSKNARGQLLSNKIYTISEDQYDNILVGTESGIGVINPVNGQCTLMPNTKDATRQIITDQEGVIWCVSKRDRITRITERRSGLDNNTIETSVISIQKGISKNTIINTIYALSDNEILVGTSTGLYKVNKRKLQLDSTGFQFPVTTIFSKDNNDVWIGTQKKGLFLIKPIAAHSSRYKIAYHRSIDRGNHSGLYKIIAVSTIGRKHIVYATPGSLHIMRFSYSKDEPGMEEASVDLFDNNSVNTILVDNTSNIWIGKRHGLSKIKRQRIEATYLKPTLSATGDPLIINDILYDHNYLWIATANKEIISFNYKTKKYRKTVFSSDGNPRILRKSSDGSIVIAGVNSIWEVGSEPNGGIHVIKKIELSKYFKITDMVEVAPGEWWATTWRSGLIHFYLGQRGIKDSLYDLAAAQFIEGVPLSCIMKDRNQNVWIGTRGKGLIKVSLEKGTAKHYSEKGEFPIPSDRILCVQQDLEGNIWVGTRGNGILKYDNLHDTFKVFDLQSGLPSNTICSIDESATGTLWISTLNGLARYHRGDIIPFISYGVSDNIINPEFAFNMSSRDERGYVYFGSLDGIYRVREISSVARNVPVVWTGIRVFSSNEKSMRDPQSDSVVSSLLNKINTDGLIRLPHNQNSFSIGFAALDYTSPQKNRYAYLLKGWDSTWIFPTEPPQSVEYVNLPTGHYTFEVKASNSLGDWTESLRSFDVIVEPSPWLSSMAIALYLLTLLLLAMVGFFIWKKWARLSKNIKSQSELTDLQTDQMLFFDELSHEIKSRLTLILGPLEQALSGKKVNPVVLNKLYDQALRLKRLSDQMMNIRNGQNGNFILSVSKSDINHTIEMIIEEVRPLSVVKNISLTFCSLSKEIKGWIDEELIEIILLNVLSNAIKYTNKEVQIRSDCRYLGDADLPGWDYRTGNYFYCEVLDDGIGISKKELARIFEPYYRGSNNRTPSKMYAGSGIGLHQALNLVKLHHGLFDIKSEEGEYTAVTFYVPIDALSYTASEFKPSVENTPIVIPNEPEVELVLPDEINYNKNGKKRCQQEKFTILLADDNKEILDLLEECLEPEFKVLMASNGRDALTLLENNRIDAVISDLAMPEMDGLTLCLKIRSNENLKNMPFLVLTGRDSEEQKLICFKNQVDDFIEKPFSPELLRWRLKGLLRNQLAFGRNADKKVIVIAPKNEIPESPDEAFIQKIVNLIDENIENGLLDVNFLAKSLYMSRATFYRRMEELVGESPLVFIRKYRLKKAAQLLKSNNMMVQEIARKTGFKNPRYFAKCFQKEFGVNPTDYISDAGSLVNGD